METSPKEDSSGDADYFIPIEGSSDDWSIIEVDYIADGPKLDPNVLFDISIKMDKQGLEKNLELPKELLKYSIELTRPELTDRKELDIELDEALQHIKKLSSSLDAQGIFNFISQKGRANIPTFYALQEVTNRYQYFFVNSNEVDELNEFDEIRKTTYWMAFYLMTQQTLQKTSAGTKDQPV